MATLFLDSSALLKRYVVEAGTERVVEMVNGDHRIGVSRLAHVEITSIIVRRGKGGDLERDHAAAVLTTFEEEFRARFSVTEVKSPTLTRAVDLVKAHSLNPTFARFGNMIGRIRVFGNGNAERSSKPW